MRIFRFFANAAFIFGALLILNSCEVGLGESVDVTAPVLEISSPADGSIIMNTFKMRGVGYDDTNIALIKVSVKSTSNGKEYASYYATADAFSKQWSVDINNKTKDANGNSKYEIPDGEYTVTVTAMDSAGRTTEKSRVYRIDNTPPVVVIKRPGAADSFGRTIKLTGDIADTNSLSSLYFTAFRKKEDGSLEKIRTIRQANISGVGLEYVIGKKYDNPANDNEIQLNNLYKELYGKEGYDGTSTLYCMVEVADCAREYEAPASEVRLPAGGEYTEAGFAPSGNLSRGFFVYNTIYSTIYSDKGYGLANSDLVSIYNGSYTGSKAGAVNEIKSYLEQNMMTTTGEPSAERMSMFTVNPNNFPYYEVSGYKYEADSSGVKKFSSLSNESKITVTVAPGRDQIDLDEKTVKLLLKKCNDNGEVIEGDDAETVVLVHSQTEIDAMTDDEEKAEAQKVRDAALSKDDTIKIVTGIGKRKTKCNYLVVVDGTDIDGNGIEASDGEKFGFFVVSVNKPPIISITEGPEDLSIAKDCNFTKFSGNVTMYADEVSLYCSITAKDEKGDAVYPVEPKEVKIPVDPKDFTWELELTDENVRNQFGVTGVPENSLYLYTISFRAVDNDENESGDTVRRVHVDTEAPKVEKINISPINTFNDRNCVNGKISISANVSENYELDRMHVYLKVGDNKCYDMSSSNLTLDFNYDTKLLKKNGTNEDYEGDLVVEVRAMDTAGNWSEVKTEKIYVNQESDKPVIRFSNTNEKINDASKIKQSSNEILNLFDKTGNNKIIANITDDDEVDQVVMRYKKLSDPDTDENWHVFVNESGLGTTSYPLSATLVVEPGKDDILEEGLYNIRYEITDKKTNGELPVQISNEFVIGIDAAAPTLIVTTASGAFIGENSNFVVKGTLEEGSGKVELTCNGTKENFEINPKGDSNTSWDWIYNGKAGTEGDSYTFRAVDKFGKVTEQAFSYKVDNTNPLVELESSGETVYLGTHLSFLKAFKGVAEDPVYKKDNGTIIKAEDYEKLDEDKKAEYHEVDASGINHVEYTINGTDWVAASGTTKWSANIDFEDSVKDADDNKKIEVRFRAVDNSNLAGEEKTSTVVIDSELPEITLGTIVENNTREVPDYNNEGTYYIKDNYVINLTVKDTNFESFVCNSQDGIFAETSSSETDTYTYTYTVGVPPAGRKTYTFTAKDKAGQMFEKAVNIFIDTTLPVPEFTAVTPIIQRNSKENVNGKITVTGTSSDNDKVVKTVLNCYVADGNGTYASAPTKEWEAPAGEADRFTFEINTAEFTDKRNLKLELVSTDRAGNVTAKDTKIKIVYIDQDTDLPVITFTNASTDVTSDAGISESTNLFAQTGSNKLLGTITDDDNIHSIVLSYQAESGDTWKEFFREEIAGNNTVSFNLSAALQKADTSVLSEGVYKICYEITDKDGNKDATTGGKAVLTTNIESPFWIGIDNGTPVLSIAMQNGELIGAYTTKAITGTIKDGNKVSLYRYAVNNSLNPVMKDEYGSEEKPKKLIDNEIKDGEWTDSIKATDNGDEFEYRAVDRFGRETKVRFNYRIDSFKPLIEVASAGTTAYVGTTNSSIVSFRGTTFDPKYVLSSNGNGTKLEDTVYDAMTDEEKKEYRKVDASGIEKITYKIMSSDETELATGTASGTTSWTANIDFAKNATEFYTDAAKVEFYAIDVAGIESVAAVRSVVVDSVLPVIDITKVEEFISSGNELVSNEGIYYSKATSGNSIKISGTVTEKYFKSLTYNSSDGSAGSLVFDADEDRDGVRKFTYTITNPTNGRKTYTFTATDKANQIKTETVEIFVDSVLPNPKFTVTTLLKDEVNGDQKSNIVNDKIFINGSSTDNDVIEKTIVICRVKNVENVAAGTITKIKLLVDGSGNPSLHEGCPVYIQADDGFEETVIPDEKVTDYNFYVDTTTLAKGEYEIEVRSTDRAGNVGSYIVDIFVNQESDRPKVRFTNMPGATAKENLFGLGSTVIYGSAEDDDGIRKITYKIDNGEEKIYYELSGAETPSTTQSISLNVEGISPSLVSGEHSVVFTVYDVNSKDTDTKDNSYKVCTPVPSPFGYDTAQPVPSVTSLNGLPYQDSMFAPHNFTVVGTATEDYKIETVVFNKNPSVNLWNSATKTWTDNVTGQADTDANALAVRNYTVTDYFGRSATLSISFRVDTAKPVFNKYPAVTNPSASDYEYRKGYNKLLISDGSKTYTENEKNGSGVKNDYFVSLTDGTTGKPVNWFKGNSITISGRVADANFNSVELFVGSEPTARASQQSANFSFTNAFDVGQQLFKLVATDKAGNKTVLGPYTIYIDTSNPSITSTSVKDSGGNDVTGASVLKNTETLKVEITAQDPKVSDEINSGIRTISAGSTSNFVTALGSETFAYGTGSESAVTKELSVPLAGLADGSHTLYGRVIDAAGNYGSDTVIQTFTVDTTKPVVRITSHSNGSVVNKTITLNGSVIDANIGAGAVPVLYYSEDNTAWTAATTVAGGMVSDAKIENSQWSLKFDTSKVFNGNTSKDYYIAVAISDAAGNINDYKAAALSSGNVSTEKIKISIDQDSDRPEITFNNVTLSNIPAGESSAMAMTSSNSVWIRTSVIYGTVKDDDGVSSVEYSLDGTNYSDTYEDAEGSTQQVYENGSWQILIPDGAASVYFKVTDTEGTEFTSSAGTAGSPLAGIDLNAPKIKDSKPNNYGYRTGAGVTASQNIYDTVLYATFDTTSPDIPYYYFTRNDCSEITAETLSEMDKWTTAKIEDAGWKSLNQISTEIFGGPGSKFYIWTKASDANGINALFIKLGENVQTEKVHKKIDPITTGTKKDGYYLGLYEIDTSKDDGTVSLVINAKDAANGTADQKFMLVQDNAAPMVTIRSPSSSGMNYYGSVNNNMHGITEDAHGIKELYIGFSASKTERPASYERIDQYTAASGWSITFDGESPENTPGSIIYLAQNLNKYLDTVYGTGTSATDVIKDLYVWMYAVDEYGNSSENDSDSSTNTNRLEPTRILVTTQGDKPTVSIAYPVMDAIGSNAIAPTVGGTVRINGSTAIAADSVEAIWIQIDPEPVVETTEIAGKTYVTGITTFHDNWHSTLQGLMNAKGVTGYTIESSSDEGSTVPAGIGYGIKAKGTASSWSLSVNAQSELNKQVDGVYVNRYIAIRAYAVSSTNHKISEAFTVPVVIDPSAPVFGGTTSLVLVKRSGDAADGEIVQSINYEPDMWISGQWYLTGSVEDDSGISHLYFNDNDLVASGNYIKENDISSSTSAKNYNINIPVGSSAAEDFGPLAYTLEAYEGGDGGKSTPLSIKLNLDNKSPEFSADLAVSGNRVLQSNGTYTITGTFNEPSSGAKNQSGFNRIVLFFTRTIGGTTYIVDPMITNKSVVSGTTVYDANQYSVTNGSGFTKDEAGIYWRTLYVQFFDSNEIKLSETEGGAVLDVDALAAKNVRIGGLININKVTFRIDGIKADGTLTLNNTPAVIAENDKALCALAQIIDHVTREQGTTASYNQLVPDKDDGDGDQMIEGVWLAGGKYNWEAELYSLNIADGPIDIHLVAFDAAGNHTADNVYSGSVINNQPRIAGIYFGTDNNGNGSVDEEELTKYSSLYDKDDRVTNLFVATELNSSTGRYRPVHQKETPSDLSAYSSAMIIKGNSIVRPEIIGGNAGLDYTYTIKKYGAASPYYTKPAVSELSSGHYEYTDSPSDVARTFYNKTTNPTGVKDIDLSIKQILTHGSTSNSAAADYIDGSKQLFSFTISDRTAGGVQTAKIDMLIDVALLDSTPPTISMIPFYWKNNVDNSIYKTGSSKILNGHIELEADWLGAAGYDSNAIDGEYDSDPKVSGTIVLEGTSNDNVRLNKLFIKIPGYTDSMGDDGIANSGKMLMAYRDSAGKWKSNGNLSDDGWVWTQVGDEVFDAVAGNTVNWSFTWNTAKTISTVAKADVEIQIFAQDMGPVSSVEGGTVSFGTALMSAPSTQQTTKAENTARYKVDVVPYITELTTTLSKIERKNHSVYGRTATGKYPVYYYTKDSTGSASSETVGVEGFNLTGGTVTLERTGSTLETPLTTTASLTAGSDGLEFEIPANAKTGKLSVTVNELVTLNNVNATDSKGSFEDLTDASSLYDNYKHYYNRCPNNVNNDLLNDDVEVAIWGINAQSGKSDSGEISEVSMHVNPQNGQLGFAFAYGNYGSYPFGTDRNGNSQTYSYQRWCKDYTPVNTIRFIYDKAGHMFGLHAGTDTNQCKAARFRLVSSIWGQSYLSGDDNDDNCAYSAQNALRLEYMGQYNPDLYPKDNKYVFTNGTRFNYHPQLASSIPASDSKKTNLYLMYYDQMTNELRFRAGQMSNITEFTKPSKTFNQNTANSFGDFYDDAYADGDKKGDTSKNYLTNYNHVAVVASTATSSNFNPGTEYSIAVVKDVTVKDKTVDVVVAVWHDSRRSTLWYSYIIDPLSEAGRHSETDPTRICTHWKSPIPILDGNSGGHCAIEVDDDNHVHIAAYSKSNTGSLIYTYLDNYDSDFDADKNSCVVDSYGTTGQNITIDFAKNDDGFTIPYIGYYMASLQYPKYAYLVDTESSGANGDTWAPKDGSDDDNMYTGAWESITLPTTSEYILDDFYIGVYRDSNGHLANIPAIEESLGNQNGVCGGNGSANPVIGYGVKYDGKGYVETAQLK